EKLLVPYETYVQLWNQAFPEDPIDKPPVPMGYALAGVTYQTRLEGDGFLLLRGQLIIDVLSDQAATVPLPIAGVVFEQARIDGKPARMQVVAAEASPQPQSQGLQNVLPGAD